MANRDYSRQLEAMFSGITPEPEAEESREGFLLEEVVTDLLWDGATVEPVAAESSIMDALLSPTEGYDKQNGSSLSGAVAGFFGGEAELEPITEPAAAPMGGEESWPQPESSFATVPSVKAASKKQYTRIPNILLPALIAVLGVLSVFLLVRLIWPTTIAWLGFHILYLVACMVAVAVMVMFNPFLSRTLQSAEEERAEAIHSQARLQERLQTLTSANALLQKWTLQFQTAAQVLHGATSKLDLDQLVQQTVELTRERFGLHYVGLFLVDQSGQWAVLRAGSGEVGRQMVAQGYRLKVGGASPVGWCTSQAQAHIALDSGSDPLLPETRSVIALPLQSRHQVIGALDLQANLHQAFSEEDVAVLEMMANQLAIAIDNAQTYAKLQNRLEEAEKLQRSANGKRKFRLDSSVTRYERSGPDLTLLGEQVLPEVQQAISQEEIVVNSSDDQERAALVAPVTLRGQAIGALGFQEYGGHQWTDDEIALLQEVADQMALAVENVRLFEQTQVALAETEALYRASHHITASADLASLYQILVNEVADRLDADQCQLTIFDDMDAYGEIVAQYRPLRGGNVAAVLVDDNPLIAILRDTQRPLAIEDVSAHPATAGLREVLTLQDVKSMLLVPIAELEFCQALASQAAITIDNMRAFEEQKETTERLREIDRFKTQFLANMSHELRTPLNSIIGFSRVILKGIDGPLTDLQQTDLAAIYNSGQHLLGLINDILDLSKIEAGKMELSFDEVDLKPIIKGVMSTAVGLVKDRPIELEQQVPKDLPIIWADGTRVRQVLLNLISNATKFTESGKIILNADHNRDCVTLSVTDTGLGIPQEKLGDVFEEFTQVDGSTTRRFGGTGLGLPISRHFVEMHGGKIAVESQVGVGSTFRVTLPIHRQTEPEAVPITDEPEEALRAVERRLILVVDDDTGVISLYQRYLEGEGYQVVGVANGEEVLDKAIELQPFAITLDVLMPTKDGWQVLQELKDCPQTQHIPIIICSIISNKGLAFSLGAADYLVKPVMEEELLAALSRLNQGDQETKVLMIDDQADDILLIRRILEAQPQYRLIEAYDGQSGINLVRKSKPDLIILDLMMPEIDGFAVLETLKREPDTRDIPVIVVTAKVLTEEERHRLLGQVEALLRKGLFSERELLEDLHKALSRIELRRRA
jgi:signal transduction histidine kinase/response regulator RpfG family c-di-GMP phosphodiesterase/putative methionine-R-sulfoxide reductase with GAF domain